MKSVRVLRNLMNVGLLLFMSLFLIQCGSGSGSGISEDKKPKIYKIDVSMVQAVDPAFAVPVGISADGKTLYGTVFLSTSNGIVPVNGFRWTRDRGTVLFNDVPGYKDYVTLATHASDDSKVITCKEKCKACFDNCKLMPWHTGCFVLAAIEYAICIWWQF